MCQALFRGSLSRSALIGGLTLDSNLGGIVYPCDREVSGFEIWWSKLFVEIGSSLGLSKCRDCIDCLRVYHCIGSSLL